MDAKSKRFEVRSEADEKRTSETVRIQPVFRSPKERTKRTIYNRAAFFTGIVQKRKKKGAKKKKEKREERGKKNKKSVHD